MAATYEFSDRISCSHGLSWSKDQRIAICTDTSIKILLLTASTDDTDAFPKFVQSFIPINETIWDISELTDKDYKLLIKDLSREDFQLLTVDKILNPFKFSQNPLPLTGFSGLSWSPQGGDHLGRSILATLSHDYRLCLYTQKSSQFDWYKVGDLTEKRHAQTKLEAFTISKSTFHQYVVWCFSQAVVAMSWCPRLYGDKHCPQKYGILAAAVKSGNIVIWRVNVPSSDLSDCSVLTTITPKKVQPKSVFWNEYNDCLVVSYVDGTMYGLLFDPCATEENVPVMTCIWKDADLMLVSSLVFLPTSQSGDQYLLFTKESVFYLLQLSDNLEVLSHVYTHGDHTLPVSDLCMISDFSYLAMSLDGTMQKVHVNCSANDDSKLSISEVASIMPPEDKWTNLFGCASPNKAYLAFVARPRPGFDHLDKRWKFPVKVQVCPISETGLVTDAARDSRVLDLIRSLPGSLHGHLDILAAFKDMFMSSVNVTNVEDAKKDIQYDVPLKIRRFCLQLVISKMKTVGNFKEVKDGLKNPELKGILKMKEEQYWDTTNKIILSHIKECTEKISLLNPETLNETESISIQCMYQALSQHQEQMSQEPDFYTTQASLQQLSKGDNPVKCCICDGDMKLSDLQWNCPNGHILGMCCKTLMPCEDITYSTCTVCGVFSLSPESLKDVRWLDGNPNQCVMCDGVTL